MESPFKHEGIYYHQDNLVNSNCSFYKTKIFEGDGENVNKTDYELLDVNYDANGIQKITPHTRPIYPVDKPVKCYTTFDKLVETDCRLKLAERFKELFNVDQTSDYYANLKKKADDIIKTITSDDILYKYCDLIKLSTDLDDLQINIHKLPVKEIFIGDYRKFNKHYNDEYYTFQRMPYIYATINDYVVIENIIFNSELKIEFIHHYNILKAIIELAEKTGLMVKTDIYIFTQDTLIPWIIYPKFVLIDHYIVNTVIDYLKLRFDENETITQLVNLLYCDNYITAPQYEMIIHNTISSVSIPVKSDNIICSICGYENDLNNVYCDICEIRNNT